MKLQLKAAILSTCFLALSACPGQRVVTHARPDLANPARMACEGVPENRPDLPAQSEIDWQAVLVPGDAEKTLSGAQAAHTAYVARMIERNGIVASYLVKVEGRLFVCSSNMQWWRDYWRSMPGE